MKITRGANNFAELSVTDLINVKINFDLGELKQKYSEYQNIRTSDVCKYCDAKHYFKCMACKCQDA